MTASKLYSFLGAQPFVERIDAENSGCKPPRICPPTSAPTSAASTPAASTPTVGSPIASRDVSPRDFPPAVTTEARTPVGLLRNRPTSLHVDRAASGDIQSDEILPVTPKLLLPRTPFTPRKSSLATANTPRLSLCQTQTPRERAHGGGSCTSRIVSRGMPPHTPASAQAFLSHTPASCGDYPPQTPVSACSAPNRPRLPPLCPTSTPSGRHLPAKYTRRASTADAAHLTFDVSTPQPMSGGRTYRSSGPVTTPVSLRGGISPIATQRLSAGTPLPGRRRLDGFFLGTQPACRQETVYHISNKESSKGSIEKNKTNDAKTRYEQQRETCDTQRDHRGRPASRKAAARVRSKRQKDPHGGSSLASRRRRRRRQRTSEELYIGQGRRLRPPPKSHSSLAEFRVSPGTRRPQVKRRAREDARETPTPSDFQAEEYPTRRQKEEQPKKESPVCLPAGSEARRYHPRTNKRSRDTDRRSSPSLSRRLGRKEHRRKDRDDNAGGDAVQSRSHDSREKEDRNENLRLHHRFHASHGTTRRSSIRNHVSTYSTSDLEKGARTDKMQCETWSPSKQANERRRKGGLRRETSGGQQERQREWYRSRGRSRRRRESYHAVQGGEEGSSEGKRGHVQQKNQCYSHRRIADTSGGAEETEDIKDGNHREREARSSSSMIESGRGRHSRTRKCRYQLQSREQNNPKDPVANKTAGTKRTSGDASLDKRVDYDTSSTPTSGGCHHRTEGEETRRHRGRGQLKVSDDEEGDGGRRRNDGRRGERTRTPVARRRRYLQPDHLSPSHLPSADIRISVESVTMLKPPAAQRARQKRSAVVRRAARWNEVAGSRQQTSPQPAVWVDLSLDEISKSRGVLRRFSLAALTVTLLAAACGAVASLWLSKQTFVC